MIRPLYLDYNSTTPMDPRVLKAMKPFFIDKFGNAASHSHFYGWEAQEFVDQARERIAQLIGAQDKKSIIFTSGATESNNMVIKGMAKSSKVQPVHMITQTTEHKCILESCAEIQKQGHQVTILDVDEYGLVDPQKIDQAIQPNTVLCSIMYANNEIGTIQPIHEIAKICSDNGILFHTDAVQAVGKISMDVQKNKIDFMSLSGHKIYGPKGLGALYVSPQSKVYLSPLLHGGSHEEGLRSGTLNVPGVIGLAKALELCIHEMEKETKRQTKLRDHFISEIQHKIEGVILNGHPTQRLANNINISIPFIKSNDLIMAVPEIAISSGSACTSGSPEPSYVIGALTQDKDRIESSIRIGLGRWTKEEDVDKTISLIVKAVQKLRKKSLQYQMSKARN